MIMKSLKLNVSISSVGCFRLCFLGSLCGGLYGKCQQSFVN
jgi:hypothetical protein